MHSFKTFKGLTPMKIAFFGDSLTEGIQGASYFEILKKKLPEHQLFNFGKGGDTVISLYKRIRSLDMNSNFDISFLWVGVNDVLVKTSWIYPILKRIRRQPWAKKPEDFEHYYRSLLDLLKKTSQYLVTVSPLFIGEDIDNTWNKELAELAKIIKSLSAFYSNTIYFNIQAPFIPLLSKENTSLKKLHFTMDGVHLNKAGADIVANEFQQVILPT